MNLAFLLFSSNHNIRHYFTMQDQAMVPLEIREKYGVSYKFFTNPADKTPEQHVVNIVKENPNFAFVVLSDDDVSKLRSLGLPSSSLEVGERAIGLEFSRLTTFWTKRIHAVWKVFEPMGNRKALLLPKRNFIDENASALWNDLEANYNERTFSFIPQLEKLLQHLRSREFPKKKKTTFKDKYFVDDKGYHYNYGHEANHGQPETEGLHHLESCFTNSKLRLGIPIENERHFNVSLHDDDWLDSHTFQTCHGTKHQAGHCKHVNMFPNDFIR